MKHATTTPRRPRLRTAAVGLTLATTLLGTACGGGDGTISAGPSPTSTESPPGPAESTTTTAEAARAVESGPVEGWELPQEMRFRAVEWTVESAVQRDRQFADGDAPVEPERWVEIGWSAKNLLAEQGMTWPANAFVLRFEDNTFVVGQPAEEGAGGVELQPEASNDGKVAFEIPEDAELSTASFEVNDNTSGPLGVRLDGSGTPEPLRVDAAVTPATLSWNDGSCVMQWDLTDAHLSRELLLDDGVPAKTASAQSLRSPKDTAYLHLTWNARSTGTGGCKLGNEQWTIDGNSENIGGVYAHAGSMWWAPNSGGWETGGMALTAKLDAGESGSFTNVWPVPFESEQLSVEFSFTGGKQSITVDISGMRRFEPEA